MLEENPQPNASFYEQPEVKMDYIAGAVPLGITVVSNPTVGIGGAYGAWGNCYNNQALPGFIEGHLGEALHERDRMNLDELGFFHRHHLMGLTEDEQMEIEVQVGARFLTEASHACGWEPCDVEGVLIGVSGPLAGDYVERIATRAGIPEQALKVSIHKACDSSVGGLQLALNPALPSHSMLGRPLAQILAGKKVLVGGIEGLSRFVSGSRDKNALQLFGNGAGVFGFIPGQTMKFLVGKTYEVFDDLGVLAVRMMYPHSRRVLVETSHASAHHIRVAGLMHEPTSNANLEMAGLMGMVKLFVRTGVQVLHDVYQDYRLRMVELGMPDKNLTVAIVHHANYKINKLMEKHLNNEGVNVPMPWLINEFGNVSSASNMIAFLRKLPSLKPHEHILFNGFGAGTYYDALAVEVGD